MLNVMQIDFVRCVLETALKRNVDEPKYFNDTDISLFSFYEQLTSDDEVNRYVERYNQLVEQQNKMDLVGFGILATTDTPSITNLKNTFVSPFEWSCTIRCTLGNRDKMISTVYKLIEELKGKKQDVALFNNGKLENVGTIANRDTLTIEDYDFIGEISSVSEINDKIASYGLTSNATIVYGESAGKLKLFRLKDGNWENVEIAEHDSFEKMKLDLSFDDVKVDEPYTLDATEFCTITFGGTGTLTNNGVKLGNDLTHVVFSKYKVKGQTDFDFVENSHDLEPMEMPSGLNANTLPNQLRSNYFKSNTHTDSIALSIQYTFLLDIEKPLLKQWFEYGRYGINNLGLGNAILQDSITPNIIYKVKEYWCSWGEVKTYEFKAKIVEDIDIENTESDVMTLGISMQIQGDND